MNIEKTKAYYAALTAEDVCDCAACRNYAKQVKAAMPELAAYLRGMGVDIEKPFETMPLEPDAEGNICYVGTQYVVLGVKDEFRPTRISGVGIDLAASHPCTDIREEHFVIELDELKLKWRLDD